MSPLNRNPTITFNPTTSKYTVHFAGKTIEITLKSATLQLCIDDKCLIVQLFYTDSIPDSLKIFMMNPDFTFVGIEVGGDIENLRDEYDLPCRKSADIWEMVKRRWLGRFGRPGLKDLALEVVGLCMSNWEARMLNEGQIEYAC